MKELVQACRRRLNLKLEASLFLRRCGVSISYLRFHSRFQPVSSHHPASSFSIFHIKGTESGLDQIGSPKALIKSQSCATSTAPLCLSPSPPVGSRPFFTSIPPFTPPKSLLPWTSHSTMYVSCLLGILRLFCHNATLTFC